eukprot:1662994-Prymnesium_polylepis.2
MRPLVATRRIGSRAAPAFVTEQGGDRAMWVRAAAAALLDGARDDALLVVGREVALHGVRLAGAGLAGERRGASAYRRLEAAHDVGHQRRDAFEDLVLCREGGVHVVKVVGQPLLARAGALDQRDLLLGRRAVDDRHRVALLLARVHWPDAHGDAHVGRH